MYEYGIGKDIEAFLDYSGMTKTVFSENLGVPRSTIDNWIKGKNSPTRNSLELVYNYIYSTGYRLNSLKEQALKDDCPTGSVILFHGAKTTLEGAVSLDHSGNSNDFGKGFYLGESMNQSVTFVCNYPNSSIYIGSLRMTKDIKVIDYYVDTEWMLTIAYFRGRLKEYENSSHLKNLLSKTNGADVIRAPIADNRMFQILDEFISGNITDLQCKSALSATDLGRQFVLVSQRAIDNLEIIGHCYLCQNEKGHYLNTKTESDRVSEQKVKYVKREFAGKGDYIEEIL